MPSTAGRIVSVVLLALVSCGRSDTVDVRLLVVVADNEIRTEGVECAGARPYEYVHAGARFTLESQDGEDLAEGELPAGRAENADPSIDWGVERIPTVCVMEVDLENLSEHSGYQFRLEGGRPLRFPAARISEDEPVRLIVQ
ncbi:MAG: hypothetical protein ACRDJL_01445 [Actinomycetota bacterium]